MARNWDACKSCSFELSWTSCKDMKGLHTSITTRHLLWKRRSRTSNLCDILGERRIPSCACPKSGNPVVYHHFPTLTWQQACAGGIHALKPNALHVDGTSSKWSHENKTNPSFEASPSAPAKRQQLLNVYGFVQTRILKNWSFHGQVMIHHRFEAFCHVLSK